MLDGFGGDNMPRRFTYHLAGKNKDGSDGIYYGDEAHVK